MSTLTLSPISDGIYTALNIAAVTNLATGGVSDTEVPQGTNFPYVWFVAQEANASGFGTTGPSRIDLRVHAAAEKSSTQGPAKVLQAILGAVKDALKDASLTLTGFQMAGRVFYDTTTEPFGSEIGGKPCWEQVSNYYFWVEPS